jgi:lysophospholipase L1-like esterase
MSRARVKVRWLGGLAASLALSGMMIGSLPAAGGSDGQPVTLTSWVGPKIAKFQPCGDYQDDTVKDRHAVSRWVCTKVRPASGGLPFMLSRWWWRGDVRVSERIPAGRRLLAQCPVPVVSTSNSASCRARRATAPAPVVPAWVGTWASAPVQAGSRGLSALGFVNQTVRDIVHTSVGGNAIRIRISNLIGKRPLQVGDVRVGDRARGATIVPGTNRQVTFGGSTRVTVPPGGELVSDPVALSVHAEQDLAVSIYFAAPTGPVTWHPAALTSNYYGSGDHSADAGGAAFTHQTSSWYFLDGVDVHNYGGVSGAVVTFGPSTTDGIMSTPNANKRYPDDLARLLLREPAGQRLSVLNAGISGNQLLASGGTSGASGLSRFGRDVIDQTGVRAVIVWEGTNDISSDRNLTASRLIAGYRQLIAVAHAHGIKVIGATLQPTSSPAHLAPGNSVRTAVNRWIRTSGAFDAVADFDRVLREPNHPNVMQPRYNSGTVQHPSIHPNDSGYAAVARVADLAVSACCA